MLFKMRQMIKEPLAARPCGRQRLLVALSGGLLLASSALAQTSEQVDFFEKKIRPVLAANCQVCHNHDLKTAELDLSSAEGFLRGGASGPLIDKDNPGESRLLKVLSYDERQKMPPTGKLKDAELADVAAWVNVGAPWPGAAQAKVAPAPSKHKEFTEEQKNFWAFQPVGSTPPPSVKNESWVRSPIDRFILARLEEKGLQPSAPAEKTTLLRRATYDLTGLPPTEREIAQFLADDSPDAFAKVVDRLLASPRYGEQWGRHWLDVARYADSTGNDEDHRYPHAWRYRDYVIEAFNNDLPYDQFVREQIAGDLLPAAKPGEVNARGIIATGLIALGPKAIAQQDKKKMVYDVYDEQLDVVAKAFMGLTITCARCHDHKFDPILTRDYYSLVGMFASTRSFEDPETHVSKLLFTPLVPEKEYAAYKKHQELIRNKKLEADDVVDRELEAYNARLSPKLAEYMLAAYAVSADPSRLAALAAEKGLDANILDKWSAYLKPRDVRRPHLDEWRAAVQAGPVEQAAQAYQTRFQERLGEWTQTLAVWREKVRRMLAEMNMPPPPKPKFEPGEDRFFHEVFFDKDGPFALSEGEQEKVFSEASKQHLVTLRAELKELEDTAPPDPDMACAVQEGDPVDQKVFIRGDYNSPGEDAPKVFPAIIEGFDQKPVVTKGSGRRTLADWLVDPDHPLTARVMANRIWHWHFGEGIVRTPSNFGVMGERPTHPELLDYLARRFVESGWSVKAMHRLLMLSSVYQLSSAVSQEQDAADPENRLLSHFNRRRLQVEEMRDGLLAIDNSLDTTMGGTLQAGVGTDGENSSKRLSINPEEVPRRMVYVPLRRANLAPLLNLFDFGDATTSTDRRARTNVAPQALFMMNSAFVAERARNVASMLLNDGRADDRRRIERAYLLTLNRNPAAAEVDTALSYVNSFERKFSGSRTPLDAWQSLCRVLISSNDFMYLD